MRKCLVIREGMMGQALRSSSLKAKPLSPDSFLPKTRRRRDCFRKDERRFERGRRFLVKMRTISNGAGLPRSKKTAGRAAQDCRDQKKLRDGRCRPYARKTDSVFIGLELSSLAR